MDGVLFVCTGNQCRSPMAAALLRAQLDGLGSSVTVASAGFVSEDEPAPAEVLDTMWSLGLDLSSHRSRGVTPELVGASALIIGMTRQHVVDLALLAPNHWERCFTFVDAVRRAEAAPPRVPSEAVPYWAQRLHGGRTPASVLGLPSSEDIPDPIGRYPQDYQRVRDQLAELAARLAVPLTPS
jgi:protein-tyrosine phosphatase